MKNIRSLLACLTIGIVLLGWRTHYSEIGSGKAINITRWDAFGYYAYVPGLVLYHDLRQLSWADEIDRRYSVTGGDGLPVVRLDNGNQVIKYLGGVAIAEAPFFFLGHGIAALTGHPQDGFSPPYQYSLAFGVIFYCLVALFVLRRILLLYFDDRTTALTLLLLCLASNFVQYAAVHNGLSHAWIFPLYVFLIYTTLQWHRQPRMIWAALTGYIIGLATISRPTEAIMLFIPLLWQTQNREASREKWRAVAAHKSHILVAVLAGILGILPQLLYWKATSGSFIYDVGSKWVFLNPNFRVLFGWEKGWFIYTPVTVLFVAGLWIIPRHPFRNSILWFCLLNIWIVIAWEDWHYGASYACRALVQSYPVFALPLAAVMERILRQRWRVAFYLLGAYLIFVNNFQIWQYNSTVLHYDDMNRKYYNRIYLNPSPSPLDMSLLDTEDWIADESKYYKQWLVKSTQTIPIRFAANDTAQLTELPLADPSAHDDILRVDARITAPGELYQARLHAELRVGDSVRHTSIRLFNPIGEQTHQYAFYVRVPVNFRTGRFRLYLTAPHDFNGVAEQLVITWLVR